MKRPLIIIFLVLLLDQGLKIWVKTNMHLSKKIYLLGDWFLLNFTENNGMAFGFELDGPYGKLILSVFRLLAVAGIGYYLWRLVKDKAPSGLIISIALILAGALGNIIDSVFYGVLFSGSSYFHVAQFMPEQGYAPLLHGKVVDMLSFPFLKGTYPSWVPWLGGDSFVFFQPIFNIADAAISVGVAIIVLFQRKYFVREKEDTAKPSKSLESEGEAQQATETA